MGRNSCQGVASGCQVDAGTVLLNTIISLFFSSIKCNTLIPSGGQDDDEEIRQVTSVAVSVAGASTAPISSGISIDGKKEEGASVSVSGVSVPFYISVVQVSIMYRLPTITVQHVISLPVLRFDTSLPPLHRDVS